MRLPGSSAELPHCGPIEHEHSGLPPAERLASSLALLLVEWGEKVFNCAAFWASVHHVAITSNWLQSPALLLGAWLSEGEGISAATQVTAFCQQLSGSFHFFFKKELRKKFSLKV